MSIFTAGNHQAAPAPGIESLHCRYQAAPALLTQHLHLRYSQTPRGLSQKIKTGYNAKTDSILVYAIPVVNT